MGIIGCGSIARLRHAPEYKTNPHVNLSGFYDPVAGRAKEMSERFGGTVYSSYQNMLSDKSIDAVSVCTANISHAPITIEALEAGKHVLCEKPMAASVEEAEKMNEAAGKTGKFLMIGHNQRLLAGHVRARQILNGGELGRIISFRTTFSHKGPETWSVDKSRETWFFDKKAAIMGAMADPGIHKADLIRWLIGDEIDEVMAYVTTLDKKNSEGKLIDVDDNAVCLLRSRSGITGTLTASWTNYGHEENSTVLYCAQGVMKIYDNPDFPVQIIYKNGDCAYFKCGRIQTNDRQLPSGVIDHFVRSIISGTPPEISGEEGLAALKIIFACMESAKSGKSVKVR